MYVIISFLRYLPFSANFKLVNQLTCTLAKSRKCVSMKMKLSKYKSLQKCVIIKQSLTVKKLQASVNFALNFSADQNAECSGYNTCASCLGSPESCHWCGNVCISSQSNTENCSKVKIFVKKMFVCRIRLGYANFSSSIHVCLGIKQSTEEGWDK